MIAAMHGCGCGGGCDHEHDIFLGELGDDSIDLSTIDFGSPAPPSIDPGFLNLAPTDFPSMDPGTILEPSGSFFNVPSGSPLSYLENNPLPTSLPPADLSEGSIPLMPESPANFVQALTPPAQSSSSTAADIAAGAAAGTGILASLKNLIFGPPAPPPGYTRNAQGQLVPMPMVAGVPTTNPLASAERWLTGKTLISAFPNWAVVGGGVAGVVLVGSLFDKPKGRRRR